MTLGLNDSAGFKRLAIDSFSSALAPFQGNYIAIFFYCIRYQSSRSIASIKPLGFIIEGSPMHLRVKYEWLQWRESKHGFGSPPIVLSP